MSLLKAYLSKPSTQRVLNRKPGEKGFSLIELVVVVAVLAILAAIAVPAFMGMSEDAADAAAKTNLKNAYKECAYQVQRGVNNNNTSDPMFDTPQNDAYWAYTYSGKTTGQCDDPSTGNVITATKSKGSNQGTLTMNAVSGVKGNSGKQSW